MIGMAVVSHYPDGKPASGVELELAASAARTADGNGAELPIGQFSRAMVLLEVTASATEAGDTLDVYLDVLVSLTWVNVAHYVQQAGNGAPKKEAACLERAAPGTATIVATSDCAAGVTRPALWGSKMRARWVIVDVATLLNQSHTFSVRGLFQ